MEEHLLHMWAMQHPQQARAALVAELPWLGGTHTHLAAGEAGWRRGHASSGKVGGYPRAEWCEREHDNHRQSGHFISLLFMELCVFH